MKSLYVTFGQTHAHAVNGKTFDKDCVCLVKAMSLDRCYEVIKEAFGQKYAMSYTSMPDLSYYPRGVIKL